MIRNLKALGLALFAVFAMSAMAASAASAAGEKFHSEVEPTVITSSSTDDSSIHTFTVSGQAVKCTDATFNGTATEKTVTEITVHPKYTGCTFFEEAAQVTTTGCNYRITAETEENASKEKHATIHVECEAAHPHIIVHTAACTMYIGAQTPKNGVVFTNLGSGNTRDVTIKATATVTVTKKEGPLCFLLGNSGTYTGSVTAKGFVDNGTVAGTTVTEGTEYKEGAQVGIWWE